MEEEEEVQETAAAQATTQEAQQGALTDEIEEERAPHMQWTYKVLTSSGRANSLCLHICLALQVCGERHAN